MQICNFAFFLKLSASFIVNMGRITVGNSVAMTGLMLAQFAEEDSQISLTVEEGSWFGKY